MVWYGMAFVGRPRPNRQLQITYNKNEKTHHLLALGLGLLTFVCYYVCGHDDRRQVCFCVCYSFLGL